MAVLELALANSVIIDFRATNNDSTSFNFKQKLSI